MKLVFLANHDRYFWSHRLSLARAARDAGAEVFLMMRLYDRDSGAALEREGFRVINWRLSQRSLNPFRELAAFAQVLNAYRRIRPDLAHHVTLKPIVYGEGAAKLCGQIPSVNTIAGLGSVFSTTKWGMRPVRRALLMLLRPALRGSNSRTVFQNSENRDALLKDEVVPFERTAIIRGSGVNLREFAPRPEPVGAPVVMLASRMLWEKGVAEFVSAAQILRQRGILWGRIAESTYRGGGLRESYCHYGCARLPGSGTPWREWPSGPATRPGSLGPRPCHPAG